MKSPGLGRGVDNQSKRLSGFALLTSLFAAGFELSQSRTTTVLQDPNAGDLAGAALGQQATQLGGEVTCRNPDIQPAVKVPSGYKFNAGVNRELRSATIIFGGGAFIPTCERSDLDGSTSRCSDAATRRCAARPSWTPRRAPLRRGITWTERE